MNAESRIVLPRTAAILAAIALLMIGAGAMYLLLGMREPARSALGAGTSAATPKEPSLPSVAETRADHHGALLPDVTIKLAADAVKRAGIVVRPVSMTEGVSKLRLPGVVAPNAYRQVVVTPLVAGRVTAVSVQLGDRVRKGQTIAQVYSPQLADARTRYISAVAMLEAHDRELQRTQKLVEIGAASRQELERIHAEHATQTAAVESARAQLELLGIGTSTLGKAGTQNLSATTSIPAPINGVITERGANVGLNVDSTTSLFTVVDLSTIWVLADVNERDIGRIRVGTRVQITSDAFSGREFDGRISYIHPQLDAATRTAKARIELQNPSKELRLGMYVDVIAVAAAVAATPTIPRSAVQNVGDRTVVYLADANASGKFVEREVRLGQTASETVEVVAGIDPHDLIVTAGSFSLRAERERLGLRTATPKGAQRTGTQPRLPADANTPASSATQMAKISLTPQGYEPATITVKAGRPTKLTFVRTSDQVCGTEVVFPSLKLKRALPLNQPVDIEFTPAKSGEITFVCDMNMLKGTVVVE